MFKNLISSLFRLLPKKLAIFILRLANSFLRDLTYFTHGLQMENEWERQPTPEWCDHNLDLYYYWRKKGNPLWLERGCFNLLVMRQGAKVLDLCCGDGFYSKYFYAIRASEVIGVDFDSQAVCDATKYYSSENVKFVNQDIRQGLPGGKFDNIIWNAAIEHFTLDEITGVIKLIKQGLTRHGILSGYTVQENNLGSKQHSLHEYEFKSPKDLARILTPFFKHVKIWTTDYPSRKNLYFFASDYELFEFFS